MQQKKPTEPTSEQSQKIQEAVALHQSGQLDAAETQYRKLLNFLPSNTTLLTNLGMIALQKGLLEEGIRFIEKSLQINANQPYALSNRGNALKVLKRLDEALASYDCAIALKPDFAEANYNRGNTLQDLKRLDEALTSYDRAIVLKPDFAEANYNHGNTLQALKQLDEALTSYDRAIALKPDYALAYSSRGNALKDLKRLDEALASYDCAIALKPDFADAYSNRGATLQDLKRLDEALASYDRAIALKPDFAEVYYNRGNTLKDLKRLDEALASYDRAIVLKPDFAEANYNRGNALKDLKRLDEALASYDRAIVLKPDDADAYSSRGVTLQELKRLDEALTSYDRAIVLKPDFAEAYSNRGNALKDLNRLDEALTSYDRAIVLKPDYAVAYSNRGNALKDLKRLNEALASYDRAIALKPDIDFILGHSLHTKMHLCIWDELPKYLNELTNKIDNNEKVVVSFPVLALIDDPAVQKKTAEIYVNEKYPVSHFLPKIGHYPDHAKIRIGYFSADFHNHATMHLMAELFEFHNKDQFELIAFSFGPDKQDEWRQRALLCFDQFVDVRFKSDREIALLARTMEIDIAVDLKGFTGDCRPGIFSERSAPIQVNYLGYPGTMGTEYIDYLIADRTLIPEDKQQHYSEKIVYLPNSYQVNVSKRSVTETALTRQESGLPDTGFVFCCFNSNYKITPTPFAGWMRILKAVEGSILWLFESNSSAVNNLRKEAIRFGINEDRLIFAKHLPVADHLNRIQMADLFIDTLPYNAHTTTSDALRMELPVLTLIGHSFASRVAASLLNAVNLPELITTTQEQYESLAIELATHPEKLKTIRDKLINNLPTAPLYDTPLFTKHLESAYMTMIDRYQQGLDPEHIYVEQQKKTTKTTPEQSQMIQVAVALHQSGQLDAAELEYKKLLNFLPSNAILLTNLGTITLQKGNLEDGIRIIGKSLQINPNQPYALNNRGNALKDLKRLDEALASYDRAIVLKPDYAEANYNRGVTLKELKRLDEALASYDRAIALKPDYAEANYNRGNILKDLNRLDEALASYDRAIALKPDFAEAYSNRGNALKGLNRLDEALASYDRVIVLKPDYAEANYNRGVILKELKRLDEALASYERAIEFKPDYADAYYNRGNTLQDLKRLDEALASYDRAIVLKPDFAEANYNHGNTLQALNRLDEALASYDRAIAIKPDINFILGYSLHTKMNLCIWDDLPKHLNELTHKVYNNDKVASPFSVLALIDDPEIQKKTAEIFVKEKYPVSHVLPKIDRYSKHSKIRIGYFSADFRIHPVSNLTVEHYETHDRNHFEIHAFSFGPDTKDEMNLRIKAGVDHFHDVLTLSDKEVAILARHLEIDIAVDLGGLTADSRTGIFAMQAAPIQVNYLGYSGTMGAEYMDYLIADQTLIPEEKQKYYLENIVYLPHSFMVNDSKYKNSKRIFTREETGLPTNGFVFCCFNNFYKITPNIFNGWMRILFQVDGSVLWLPEGNSTAVKNLKKEARKNGIDENRLIFAPRLTFMEDHLNRIQLADLFLDTLPYNAHTTTSDALRMGLPVLTCMGHSFASRVAASLLNAVHLPELITTTQEQYESLAIELAMHPEKLKTIKDKLITNLPTAPLYDTPLFTKHLESAYLTMVDRYQRGLDPEHIYVEH